MPLSVPANSRRQFIMGAVTTIGGIITLKQEAFALSGSDPDFIALLSDTHIAADPTVINRKTNMTDNLKAVRSQLLDLPLLPNSTSLNGECAYLVGLSDDYNALAGLIDPLAKAGHSMHYLMGNHDKRDNFRAGIKSAQKSEPLEGRHVTRLECRKANIVMLDSLDKTNGTPGILGAEQLKWIETALDMDKNKPTIVMVHHNPVLEGPTGNGLTDSKALFDILVPRKNVKMVVFGHTHKISFTKYEGIHLVNLPPVAYPFAEGDPSGWVAMHLAKTGAEMKINALNGHPVNGKSYQLDWRS